jgi:large repetitive protein
MQGFKPFPVLGLAILLCALLMTACGGKLPANGPGALNIVTTSPLPTGAESDPYSQTIRASGGTTPYTWTLDSGTLPPGFSFSTGGVLSGTPPAGSAGNYTFTVRVTDSQSPTKAYNTQTLTVTINTPLSFTTSTLANGVIGSAYSAMVGPATGGVNCVPPQTTPCYTYTLAPGSSQLPAGLTLSAAGAITGTPTGPAGTFPFTVQATDGFPTTATANFSITIVGKIQGTYAFSFNGYDNGKPFYMAGSFCADGNGNINPAGCAAAPGVTFMLDRNGSDGIGAVTSPFTGTYTIDNTTNLGTMMLTIPGVGTYNYSLAVSTLSDSRFIESDANVYGSGVIRSTTTTSLPTTVSNCGGYSFGSFGNDSAGNRFAGAGSFVPDASGNLTGVQDTNDNGTAAGPTSFTGTLTPPSLSSPRGTVTFNIGSSTIDYAFYVVVPSASPIPQLLAVQTDPISGGASVTLANMIRQFSAGATCTFGNQGLNGAAVTELNAVSNGGTTPDISLGVINFDGNGNITSYVFDENNAGVLTTPAQNSYTGTYNVDSKTARVTVTGLGSYQPVWYLTSANGGANSAFVVGTDPSVTSGTFEPQGVSPPVFYITSLSGNFYGSTSNPVLPSVTNEAESAVAAPPPPPGTGNGTFTSTYDTNGTGGVLMNQMFSGIYCLAGNSDSVCPSTQLPQNSTSRTIIEDGNGNTVDILYLASPSAAGVTGGTGSKSVTLSTGPNPSLSVIVH